MKKLKGILLSLGVLNLASFDYQVIAQEFTPSSNYDSEDLELKETTLSSDEIRNLYAHINEFATAPTEVQLQMLDNSMRGNLIRLNNSNFEIVPDLMTSQELLNYQNQLTQFWNQSNAEREEAFRRNLLNGGLRNGRSIDPCKACC